MHTCKDLKPMPFMDTALQQLVITSPHHAGKPAQAPVTHAPAVSKVSTATCKIPYTANTSPVHKRTCHTFFRALVKMPPCTNLCPCLPAIGVFPKGEHLPQCHSVAPHITSTGESVVMDSRAYLTMEG